jgi:uncharacterized membrane protein
MKKMRKWSAVGILYALLSIAALLLQYLALADIAKGETDVRLEWIIVGVAMLVLAGFVIFSLIMLVITFITPKPSGDKDAKNMNRSIE